MAGTARQSLPAGTVTALGLDPDADPARTALRALAAANLLRKAATPLVPAPGALPGPCPPDERPLCRPGAIGVLKTLVEQETYRDALPEFFELLVQSGKRLPPEVLPLVFHVRVLPEGAREAIGALGRWLALQHPEWRHHIPGAGVPSSHPGAEAATAQWATGTFKERYHVLRDMRATLPETGLAWLSTTWEQEPAPQKARFLELLRTGLSTADLPLLERAMADKNAEVRFLGLRLCLLLPGSRPRRDLRERVGRHLDGSTAPAALPGALENRLPEAGLFSKMGLLALRGRGIKNLLPDPFAAIQVLLKIIPPDDWQQALHPDIDRVLALFDDPDTPPGLLSGLLDAIAWYQSPGWVPAVLSRFSSRPEHACWSAASMKELLRGLPLPAWQSTVVALAGHPHLLEAPDSALIDTLASTRHPWPKALVQAVLAYPIRSGQARHWQPPPHLLRLLDRAAYSCRPEEALALEFPDGTLPYAWHSALMSFRMVAGFRRQMREQM